MRSERQIPTPAEMAAVNVLSKTNLGFLRRNKLFLGGRRLVFILAFSVYQIVMNHPLNYAFLKYITKIPSYVS
jgi:hypothetical protein